MSNIKNYFNKISNIQSVISVGSLELANRVLMHIIIFILALKLSANDYGIFSGYRAYCQILVAFIDLGLTQAAIYFESRGNKSRFRNLLSLKIIIYIFLTIVLLIALTLINNINDYIFIYAILLAGIADDLISFVSSYYYRHQLFNECAKIRLLPRCTYILVVYFFVNNLSNALYIWIITSILTIIIVTILSKKLIFSVIFNFRNNIPSKNILIILSKKLPIIYLAGLSGVLLPAADMIVLNYFSMAVEAGNYNIASRLASLAVLPVTILLSAFLPSDLDKYKLKKIDYKTLQKYLCITLLIGLISGVIYYFFINNLVIYIFQNKFTLINEIKLILTIDIIILYIWSTLSYLILRSGGISIISWITIIFGLLKFPIIYILVNQNGWTGVAYGSLAIDFCMMAVCFIFIKKLFSKRGSDVVKSIN